MKRVFRLSTSANHSELSANESLRPILETEKIRELTQQFGSELRIQHGESIAYIRPPIPEEKIAAYGSALIGLARTFEPEAEVDFHQLEVNNSAPPGSLWGEMEGPKHQPLDSFSVEKH